MRYRTDGQSADTPALLARGTFDSFKVMASLEGPGLFKAEAKQPIDLVVREREYVAGGSTGWHAQRLSILDVHGTVVVINGETFPNTPEATIAEIGPIVESISFE